MQQTIITICYLLAFQDGASVRRIVAVSRNGQHVFLDERLLFVVAFFCLVLCWHRYSHCAKQFKECNIKCRTVALASKPTTVRPTISIITLSSLF